MNLNKVMFIGRLGKDPELKYLGDGANAVAKFSIATSESRKVNDEWKEHTEWHDIVVWRELAERVAEKCKKGNLVYIEGKLTHRKWEDKESGVTKYFTEINAYTVRKLEKGGEPVAATAKASSKPEKEGKEDAPEEGSDLPF